MCIHQLQFFLMLEMDAADFLDDCKERGESASVAAARAACSTLKNKCPSVRPTAALASAASFGRGGADSFNPADGMFYKITFLNVTSN